MDSQEKKNYSPYWPRTLVFWGAGATAELGMTTTVYLGKNLFILADQHLTLKERVDRVFSKTDQQSRKHIENLLIILNDGEGNLEEAMIEEIPENSERVKDLQEKYDWCSLKKVIRACPGHSVDTFMLSDLFHILDIHIAGGHGLYVMPGDFLRTDQLIVARNALKMLIMLIHSVDYQVMLKDKKQTLETYRQVAKLLAEMMIDEGEHFESDGNHFSDREFYLFSYAVISMNWDSIFLWLLFNAQRDVNKKTRRALEDKSNRSVALYHDLGHFMGIRKIVGETPDVWYPMNEATAQRLNQGKHSAGMRVRLGKFYFPHGSHNWRECPSCGKLTMYLGNEWGSLTGSVVPPFVLPNLMNYVFETRSKEEEEAHRREQVDQIQCPFCGTMTELLHTPIIMQSSNKGWHPSFIEEIQRDMRVAIQRAKHIVLMGYSLPTEDVIFRSLLSARQHLADEPKKCTIITGNKAHLKNKWVYGKDIKTIMPKIDQSSKSAIKTVIDIFGSDNMRYYGRGIPHVFLNEKGLVDKERIQDIFEWG